MRQLFRAPSLFDGFLGVVGSHTRILWGSQSVFPDGGTDGRTGGRRMDGRTADGRLASRPDYYLYYYYYYYY